MDKADTLSPTSLYLTESSRGWGEGGGGSLFWLFGSVNRCWLKSNYYVLMYFCFLYLMGTIKMYSVIQHYHQKY